MSIKVTITEAHAEKLADRMVWQRLDTDKAYNYANNATAQSEREDEISAQVWRELETKYNIA